VRQNIRVQKEDDRDESLDPTISRFVPTNPDRDRYIEAATLHPSVPSKEDSFAGIPLDNTQLRELEVSNTAQCINIDLKFKTVDGTWNSMKGISDDFVN
jgi:hypothetical protein